MSTKVVYCPKCGEMELSQPEYNEQMMFENFLWVCPRCESTASWVGEFSPCFVCNEPTSHDVDNCQHCGISQESIYYAMRGDADAQNFVRKQCQDGDA